MLNLKDTHKNLEQRAYEVIKDHILSGRLKPHIRLKEDDSLLLRAYGKNRSAFVSQ